MESWDYSARIHGNGVDAGVVTPYESYYISTPRLRHNIGPCVWRIPSVKLVAHARLAIIYIAQVPHKLKIAPYRGYVRSAHESV